MSMSTKKVIVDGDDNSRGRVHSDAVENQKKTTEGREEARRRVSSQQESGVLVAEKSEDRSVCDIADLPAVKKEGDVPPPPPIQKPSEQTLVKVESEELRGDPGSGEKLTSPPQTDNAEVDNGGIIDEAYKIEPEVVDDEMGECEDNDEPKATGRKPRGRRKRAGGIELDEEILQQQQMKGEGSGEEDGDDEGDGAPRYQSSRAAAMIAKSRLSVSGSTKSRGAAIGADTAEEAVESLDKKPTAPLPKQWVCCDTCGKWRSIPGEVDTSNLPEQWHCSLNEWDEGHNDCSHEEEEYVEEPEPAVVDPVGAKGGDDEIVGRSVQGRKRRGRIPYGATSADDEADNDVQQMSIAVPVVENVTWVQCNKCSKWRKVPGRINQKDLPDVWYCVMNTWAPEYARCSAKEEVEEVLPAAVGPVGRGAGVGRGRYVRRGRTDDGGAAPVAANG
ncbi:MORC4, partial [Symbiodinium microadriaticum]